MKRVEAFAKLGGNWFACGCDQRAIDMIAEDLLVSVVLASGRVDETTSEDIENTGLKEDQLLLVGLADTAV